MSMPAYHMMFEPGWLAFALMLIPYLLGGIYLLRARTREDVEVSPLFEGLALVLVILFFMYEFSVIEDWLGNNKLKMLAASLGLLGSGIALYGPTAVSLASYLFTEMLMPRGYWAEHEPRYGAAEGMETLGDFEGAANEYIVLARMFPHEPRPALGAADNLMKLDRHEEAAKWFVKGLALLQSPGDALPVTNRLYDLYNRHLSDPAKAREVLTAYAEKYPGSEFADSVQKRVERHDANTEAPEHPSSSEEKASAQESAAAMFLDEEPLPESGQPPSIDDLDDVRTAPDKDEEDDEQVDDDLRPPLIS